MFKSSNVFGNFIAGFVFVTIFLTLVSAVIGLVSLLLMWLWNTCLVGTITGINSINFLKAVGILLIGIILFKNIPYQNNKNNS